MYILVRNYKIYYNKEVLWRIKFVKYDFSVYFKKKLQEKGLKMEYFYYICSHQRQTPAVFKHNKWDVISYICENPRLRSAAKSIFYNL